MLLAAGDDDLREKQAPIFLICKIMERIEGNISV
jgi:hypothetical protein